MHQKFSLMILTALLISCASTAITPDDVTGPESWGASDNVTHLKHLYFSEQPDKVALQVAKSKGVTTVIDLRHPSELDWDEQTAAEEAGLEYVNIPIARQSKTLDSDAIRQISEAVRQRGQQQVLLHCSSGNRASAWLAAHLVDDHGMNTDDALEVAGKAGLTNDAVRDRVRTYLGSGDR